MCLGLKNTSNNEILFFNGDTHRKEEKEQGELLKLRQSSPWGRILLYHFLAVKSWRWQEGLNLQSFAVVRTDLNHLLQGKHVKKSQHIESTQ